MTDPNLLRKIPTDLLNDLSSRFIINVPEEERSDLIRLCFQIELAHWFYKDFYCEEKPSLPKVNLKDFIRIIFAHVPFLNCYTSTNVEQVINDWREYKQAVPTFGGILLDEDLQHVLLVQSFVYKASWGFPKGKVNKDEQPHHCAIREVLEETGFDITDLVDQNEYLEYFFNDQLIRLYIVPGVPKTTRFQPQTRNEIRGCEWFALNQLPANRNEQTSKNFFMVMPFVKPLKKWIANRAQEQMSRKQMAKQQQLFLQSTKSDFLKATDKVESKSRSKSTYSPPPRLAKRRQERKSSPAKAAANEDKNAGRSKSNNKKSNDATKTEKTNKPGIEPGFPLSKAWQNFSLDREALVAIFSVNLRKTTH